MIPVGVLQTTALNGENSMVTSLTTDSHFEGFNEHHPVLFRIAWRMLGNPSDTEDILQQAYLRWLGTKADEVRSPRAFLVTMVTRLCLNDLDLARVKREVSFELEETSMSNECEMHLPTIQIWPMHSTRRFLFCFGDFPRTCRVPPAGSIRMQLRRGLSNP